MVKLALDMLRFSPNDCLTDIVDPSSFFLIVFELFIVYSSSSVVPTSVPSSFSYMTFSTLNLGLKFV